MTKYDIGDAVRVSAQFTSLTGSVADPTTVSFLLKDPAGTETTPAVSRTGIGVYYSDILLTAKGTWLYRWQGIGAVQAAAEGSITVRPSSFV